MKKKGARDIPDFSHKTPLRTHGSAPDAGAPRKAAPPPAAPRTAAKPQSTSAKSGRRGQ